MTCSGNSASRKSAVATTSAGGFAVGRARFCGETLPLDSSRALFEFVGLDRLLPNELPAFGNTNRAIIQQPELKFTESAAAVTLSREAEQSIPSRFDKIATTHGPRVALEADAGQLTYSELNAAASQVAAKLLEHSRAAGERVAILMRQDVPLIASESGRAQGQ